MGKRHHMGEDVGKTSTARGWKRRTSYYAGRWCVKGVKTNRRGRCIDAAGHTAARGQDTCEASGMSRGSCQGGNGSSEA